MSQIFLTGSKLAYFLFIGRNSKNCNPFRREVRKTGGDGSNCFLFWLMIKETQRVSSLCNHPHKFLCLRACGPQNDKVEEITVGQFKYITALRKDLFSIPLLLCSEYSIALLHDNRSLLGRRQLSPLPSRRPSFNTGFTHFHPLPIEPHVEA